jgi:hypothetical protein
MRRRDTLPRGLKPDSLLETDRRAEALRRPKAATAACFHKLSGMNPLKPKTGLSGAPGYAAQKRSQLDLAVLTPPWTRWV